MSIDDRLRVLHQDGFVLMQGVLDARQIADLRHAIDQLKPCIGTTAASSIITNVCSIAIRSGCRSWMWPG